MNAIFKFVVHVVSVLSKPQNVALPGAAQAACCVTVRVFRKDIYSWIWKNKTKEINKEK